MNPKHRFRAWQGPLLKVIYLAGAFSCVGTAQARTTERLKNYPFLSSYFDALSSAAGEDPWIEFFGVKEARTFPKTPIKCNFANSQSTQVAVSAWVKRVESDLNQNLEVPILMTNKAELELASWLSEKSYKICEDTLHQDLSTTQFLYLIPYGQKIALIFEVGYED